ncbi:MAG: hypothetical protein LBG11_07595 [Bifidobacteriaceae bacterium]|nr:hypothetical protein [Bifidobacteriaceae bacterium]
MPRPLRKTEYALRFATRQAEKGWTDLVATAVNAAVTVWEFWTQTPTAEDGRDCYRLAGQMARHITTADWARARHLLTR